MTAPVLGVIADDFTGATDIAGLLARSGADVTLHIGVPDDQAHPEVSQIEVIALKCRSTPVDEAVNDCLAALKWLRSRGASRFFWKYCSTFDSTPAGNIGPVAEALMQALETEQTIYCPAFPENGRSIFMGNLFVGRKPLAESPMRDHPLNPMRDSNLVRLLDPQVTKPTGLVDRFTVARGIDAVRAELDDLARHKVAHIIVDAIADADVEIIANACFDLPLITGGSAVAMPLPAIYNQLGWLALDKNKGQKYTPAPAAVILSGSCSAMTRQQVACYAKKAPALQLSPLALAESGTDHAEAWLRSCDLDAAPLLYATAEPDEVAMAQAVLGQAEAGSLIEKALAHLSLVARDLGVARFIIAGGETSGAVVKALGVNCLSMGEEIAPGVPWTFARSGTQDIALALKSGNFGDIDFFATALEALSRS
jgi:uncharacterized protein YgbK (DUF1537 family)